MTQGDSETLGDSASARSGLFDGFDHCRTVTDNDRKEALTNGLLSLDTNILLNLYRYEDSARKAFLAVLEQLKDRLYVSHQVVIEFWNNRESVLGTREMEGKKAEEALASALGSAETAIGAWGNRLGVDAPKRTALIARLGDAFEAVAAEISELTAGSDHGQDTNADSLLTQIERLVDGRVGERTPQEQHRKDEAEGLRRVKDKIPPGFADRDKSGDAAAGDYLVWRQTLRAAIADDVKWIVFVSDDTKTDWRRDEKGSNPRAHPDLEREAMMDAGCRLLMLNSTALLHVAKEILGYDVSDDTLAAVSSVATSRDERWGDASIEQFFDRLERKKQMLADVIVYAAQNGGVIDRSTVYEICGYDENLRTLTRFTMPATGVARLMVAEGSLSEFAPEPIWALYDGPGKASGFEVPDEFVQFFAE